MKSYRKISTLKSLTEFSDYAGQFGFELNCDEVRTSKQVSALGQSIEYQNHVIGNRWCILPMEGWDCLPSGAPSEFTSRRWRRFGGSGAKLLFGCEAAAVMHEGRSSSRQMMISSETVDAIAFLRREMVEEHRKKFSRSDDLCIGLQLTHSGRFAHPEDNPRSGGRTAYAHPLLDKKFGNDISGVLSDREIKKSLNDLLLQQSWHIKPDLISSTSNTLTGISPTNCSVLYIVLAIMAEVLKIALVFCARLSMVSKMLHHHCRLLFVLAYLIFSLMRLALTVLVNLWNGTVNILTRSAAMVPDMVMI
ncbi:MAG: hypothetical protein WC198_05300 [Victivallaceae bacterium]